MKTETTIQCIACGVELKNMAYVEVHPYDGLHFRTHGHYGSAVFDPMNAHVLDIAICDLCIMNNLDRVRGTGVAELKENYEIYHDAAVKNADQNQMRKEYDK